MAKKLIISYSSNPISTDMLKYKIYLGVSLIPYLNGESEAMIDYSVISIESNLSDTIDNTIDYLRTNYIYNKITYQRVNDTIEILINYDSVNIILEGNLSYTIEDVPTEVINLKYFIQYTNKVNDSYYLGIYGRNFEGTATEVEGRIKIEKASIKDHLNAVRGTGLSIDLKANNNLTFEDLYSDNEQDYMVRLFKNNKVVFVGYLKPDGIFQSFTRNEWVISLDCVDGLGALENLSFVQDNGLQFSGKMTALDIVYYCLKRTGIVLNINTSINIYYDGLTLTDELDILSKIQMNADRFYKTDGQTTGDGTIMSCDEVLKSVLDIFCACITQQDGEWYIFKPNELYGNQVVKFKRYDLENVYTNLVTKNLNKSVGSQINNFSPHHCSGNQVIKINGGISAYRLGYKYGYVTGLLLNNVFKRENSDFLNWTENSLVGWINDPLTTRGFLHRPLSRISTSRTLMLTSDVAAVTESDLINIKINYNAQTGGFNPAYIVYKVRLGSYYLKKDGSWTTSSTFIILKVEQVRTRGNFEFTISANELPISGDIYVEIYRSEVESYFNADYPIEITDFSIVPNVAGFGGIQGEFHTSSRSSKISSIVKENKTVYNGDNEGVIYLGAIFKENGTDTTSSWFRKNFYESKPLLQIATEEQLRIAQKPTKEFSGNLYGYLPYLSVLSIDSINGKFMLTEYSYDTIDNITSIKALELFSAEISDLIYTFTFDYGNTVKPTIIG